MSVKSILNAIQSSFCSNSLWSESFRHESANPFLVEDYLSSVMWPPLPYLTALSGLRHGVVWRQLNGGAVTCGTSGDVNSGRQLADTHVKIDSSSKRSQFVTTREPDGDVITEKNDSLRDLELFANDFKQRRIKLGFTQTNVGKCCSSFCVRS